MRPTSAPPPSSTGYFRPQDGPAAKDLRLDPAALAANDPLRQAARAGLSGGPLPAFWVSTGTGNLGDETGAQAFVAALRPIEAVPLYRVVGAGHNVYAWQPAIPYALGWLWTQIAPPSLRVLFPLSGDPHDVDIQPSPPAFAGKPPGPAQPPVPPSNHLGGRA